ncbi:4'-phosphopantetheinyl transferase [Opitutus sp. ER46]|nr:4'-phosphopantetheinyl transferase [Opitutus sp. ER46]
MMPAAEASTVDVTRKPPRPGLEPGVVDLWWVALDAEPDDQARALAERLSADERERAERFFFARDRRRFVVARGVLRVLLGRYLGAAAETVAFRYGTNGKPALAAPAAHLHFNLAHSEGQALYAFSGDSEVGVDLERIRELPDWESIASTCFGPQETARVQAAPAAERRLEFFQAWARQEAVLKASGVGLAGAGRGAPAAAGAWRVFSLALDPTYAAAVAVGAGPRWLRVCRWGERQEPGRARRMALAEMAHVGPGLL